MTTEERGPLEFEQWSTWKLKALERENATLRAELESRDALILQLMTHLELGERNIAEAKRAIAASNAPPPLASVS